MKKLLLILLVPIAFISLLFFTNTNKLTISNTGAPPYDVSDRPFDFNMRDFDKFSDWERPEGPAKVALQVGHWKTDEAPDEQEGLRGNSGASGGGKTEWEVNMAIAQASKKLLVDKGIMVEILPTTIPPDYWADVFVAIHADGHTDLNKSGYKGATSWRDMTGKAAKLLNLVEKNYEESTGFEKDSNVTRNMRGYYAFRWWRYEHAIHPMTTAVIFETGFLSNPSDREIIVDKPELSAEGITNGIIEYLSSEKLI
jgi:hypothetical protein